MERKKERKRNWVKNLLKREKDRDIAKKDT